MDTKIIAPYGSWKSPITAELIASEAIQLGQIVLDGTDLYWLEGRPEEGGRYVLVRYEAGRPIEDVTPMPYNVRTRVHEYGGGAYTVHDGVITFSNFEDQRLYQHRCGEEPHPVTPAGKMRYADGTYATDGRFVCVREDHRVSDQQAVTTLVTLALDGRDDGRILTAGNDFYASPRFSPNGQQLAWITWNHPNMPWDGTELWLAKFDQNGELANHRLIAGGKQESIFQPEWSADGDLFYVSDRSGWWNLYRYRDGDSEALYPLEAEFGMPQWVFGMRTYGFVDEKTLLCTVKESGQEYLALLDDDKGDLRRLDLPFSGIASLQVAGEMAYFLGGAADLPGSVIALDVSSGEYEVLQRSTDVIVEEGYLSIALAIAFPTAAGLTAHAYYYPPDNKRYRAPAGERPPLIVQSHGGPTGATTPVFNLGKQYWTSRGFAVLDVNYGGSTGYGRAYRERLNGRWGIVDVEDCINGALYLVEKGLADENRLAIRGGSAGGYTTLCALTFHDTFAAGASHFGVSDAEALTRETHKFESRYLDNLIGPYPERRDRYIARSPIHFVDRLSGAVILFQGQEDRVVPEMQAESMFEKAKANGVPVAYLCFPGEQHGFRQAETIRRVLDAELYFYGKIFRFELADDIEPVAVANLPEGKQAETWQAASEAGLAS